MENIFNNLGLNEKLVMGLEKQGITIPTEIQEKAIPLGLENKDIIAQSETGTGKTLAFLLPLFQTIDETKRETQAIILAPTHELAMQIEKCAKDLALSSGININTLGIIGNVNIKRQVEKLREKPQIVVGSCLRIVELIKLKKIQAHKVKTIVIDECDRMLDKMNIDGVKAVIKTTLRERQMMLFSASIQDNTIEIAKGLMKDPEIIKIVDRMAVNENIEHMYFLCERRERFETLRKVLASVKPEKAIIFINRSEEVAINVDKLNYHHFKVQGIHGTSDKIQRQMALDQFRNGTVDLLVSSDLSARGLDIKGVTHIINLDIPDYPKDYLHRVGRSGRAGQKGTSICIVTETEEHIMKKYERTLNIKIEKKKLSMGKVFDSKDNITI